MVPWWRIFCELSARLLAGQIKIGSVRNTERLAKYNQLSRIEEDGLAFAGWTRGR